MTMNSALDDDAESPSTTARSGGEIEMAPGRRPRARFVEAVLGALGAAAAGGNESSPPLAEGGGKDDSSSSSCCARRGRGATARTAAKVAAVIVAAACVVVVAAATAAAHFARSPSRRQRASPATSPAPTVSPSPTVIPAASETPTSGATISGETTERPTEPPTEPPPPPNKPSSSSYVLLDATMPCPPATDVVFPQECESIVYSYLHLFPEGTTFDGDCCRNSEDEPYGCVYRISEGDVIWNGKEGDVSTLASRGEGRRVACFRAFAAGAVGGTE